MNLHENVKRIKQVMGLITEETEQDLRKILQTKFPDTEWSYYKFERQGANIVFKGFSKRQNGNKFGTYNPSDDFYFIEFIDGPNKGLKIKCYSDGKRDDEIVTRSAAFTKYAEKIKKFPCLIKYHPKYVRETNDGKIIAGFEWGANNEFVVFFNLDDSTYFVRGGGDDGEQGKFSCGKNEVEWGIVTKSGTKKSVNKRATPTYFNKVTTSEPIVRGMRDHSAEPENGLIYLIQKKLKELNFYTGEPDGQFGPLTYKAVIAFQKTGKDGAGNPLVVDGKVGPNTIASLGLTD
jgi:hypothetical protein